MWIVLWFLIGLGGTLLLSRIVDGHWVPRYLTLGDIIMLLVFACAGPTSIVIGACHLLSRTSNIIVRDKK